MDELFSSLALQTVQLVGKAAFGAAGTLALKRVSNYVSHAQHAPEPQAKLERLLARFEARLRIVTPAIDLVEIIAARGHSTLAGALHLTHSLRRDILALGSAMASPHKSNISLASPRKSNTSIASSSSPLVVVEELQALLDKIDDAVPLLNLALTTSGAHLGATLPAGVSPARLMQASAVLARAPPGAPVGQPFVLRLYSMFAASVRPKSRHDFTWKEEFVKCRLCLWRAQYCAPEAPLAYELRILEDTNDGRYHDEDEPQANGSAQRPEWAAEVVRLSEGDVGAGGSTVVIPLDRVASMYYTSAGSLLNIEDSTSPVLVLSVRPEPAAAVAAAAIDPLQNMADFGRINSGVRWYALEIAEEAGEEEKHGGSSSSSDSDCDDDEEEGSEAELSEEDEMLAQKFDELCTVNAAEPSNDNNNDSSTSDESSDESPSYHSPLPDAILRPLDFLAHEWNMCTLSLLEYMIRLASVEMTEQVSHLEVPDEKLRLYLQSATSTGSAGSDDETPAASKYKSTTAVAATPTARSRRTPVSILGTPS
ncbi:Ran-specific GTPase-activating protein 30 [Coemansia sp. RSA 2424]|nr:Ran-specific GTPase-activating protein 30 [Coemansia sp. RSA 2424]